MQEAILAELNGNLSTEDFYVRFKPKGEWQSLRDVQDGITEHQTWVTGLKKAYDEAAAVHALYLGADVLDLPKDLQEQRIVLEGEGTEEAKRVRAAESLLRTEGIHRARIAAHRKLLEAYYPGAIQDKSKIFSGVVLEHDQRTRMTWFLWSAAIFVVSACMVSLNATSWHGYYATRLANMWTMPAPGMERNIPLAAMNTTKHGYPYHLVNGALQLMGRQLGEGRYVSRDHFLLSNAMCGSDRLGYCDTAMYQEGRLTLADAIAISGGAFTPTQTSNPLLMTLLVLGNLRLGQWLDNPARCHDPSSWIKKVRSWLWVSPMRLLLRLPQRAERRPFCFVTDGGHHENLGIEPLLKRRCRLIIACDAGQDDQFSFLDFCKLLTRMRLEEGITIRPLEESETTIKLDSLVPESKQRYTKDHFLVAEIYYPPSEEQSSDTKQKSYLIFIKSSLTGDEPTELVQYHRFNPSFPHDPTADQFYSAERFAAYTQLGSHIAEILCRRLPARLDQLSVDAFIRTISGEEERRKYFQCDTRQAISTSESSTKGATAFAGLDGSFSTAPWSPTRKDRQEPRESIDQIAGTSGVHPSETAAVASDDSAPPIELSNASELDAAMEQNIRIELGDGSAATRSKTVGDGVKTKTNSSKSNSSQNKSVRRKPR